jgi:hypothetical protein
MTSELWDPADGPDPNEYDMDTDGWSDADWWHWHEEHHEPKVIRRSMDTIDPGDFL